jgi:drug/metabolite transporter (DMT)-like permease
MHVVIVSKFASRYDALSFSTGQLLVCSLLNGIVGMAFERPDLAAIPKLGLAIGFTGVFSLGLGFTLQVWAQRHAPPTDAALILSLESVVAAIGGWWFLGETLLLIQILGCGLIITAVLLSQLGARTTDTVTAAPVI